MLMSVSLITSRIRTMAVTDNVPSLIESSAVCECASMMPGVTYMPVASMTLAFGPAVTSLPTATILPLRMRIEPFSIVPCDAVIIVALRISVSPEAFCAYVVTLNARARSNEQIAVYLFIVVSLMLGHWSFVISHWQMTNDEGPMT